MEFVEITENNKDDYNLVVTHPLQSYEWGEFREKTGVKVIRRGLLKNGKIIDGFTLTLHKVPKTKFTVGYLPKGNLPTDEILKELRKIGKDNNCIFIQLEPNIVKSQKAEAISQELIPSFHPLFTKYTFVLDLTKSEEELLKNMHPKTRYNIRVAEKHGIKVVEQTTDEAFKEYLRLTEETTSRQKFFAHTPSYHAKMWETLRRQKTEDKKQETGGLAAHLLTATYNPEDGDNETLAAWILFVFHDHLYYPYGASSSKFRKTMASNLIMWEAIKFGRKHNLKFFDMWGALGYPADTKDKWYGFHKFKEGYGGKHTEFVGSYDFIIEPTLYKLYKVADKFRWVFLRIKKLV